MYFDTSSITEEDKFTALYEYAYFIKEEHSGAFHVIASSWKTGKFPPVAVAIDLNIKMTYSTSEKTYWITMKDDILEYAPWILDLPRITEEEFYKISPQFVILHDEVPRAYLYNEGMTWEEWVDSKYNTAGFVIDNDHILYKGGYVSSGDGSMRAYDTMVSDSYYVNYGE